MHYHNVMHSGMCRDNVCSCCSCRSCRGAPEVQSRVMVMQVLLHNVQHAAIHGTVSVMINYAALVDTRTDVRV